MFGILERNGRVYTTVVPDVSAQILFDHIKQRTRKGMEFRFNHKNEQLYPLLVGVIRQFAPKNP